MLRCVMNNGVWWYGGMLKEVSWKSAAGCEEFI